MMQHKVIQLLIRVHLRSPLFELQFNYAHHAGFCHFIYIKSSYTGFVNGFFSKVQTMHKCIFSTDNYLTLDVTEKRKVRFAPLNYRKSSIFNLQLQNRSDNIGNLTVKTG